MVWMAEDDDGDQRGNGDRDGPSEAQGAASEDDEDAHDRFGGIGVGGDGVGSEHRQAAYVVEALVSLSGKGKGPSDEEALHLVQRHGMSSVKTSATPGSDRAGG